MIGTPSWLSSDQASFDCDDLIDRIRRASAVLSNLILERDGAERERLTGKRDGVDAALRVVVNAPDWATAYDELNDLVPSRLESEAEGWSLARGYAAEYFRNHPLRTT